MAKGIHKGTELNNIKETWEANERIRESGNAPGDQLPVADTPATTPLDRVIKEEAAEYDNENKADRLLSGDRATLNDDAEQA